MAPIDRPSGRLGGRFARRQRNDTARCPTVEVIALCHGSPPMGASIWLLPSYGSHSASLRPRTKSMGFTSSHVEAASTLAVIASSNEPLLFLAGGDLRIIAASASFCRTFQIDPASIPGRQLSEL